MTDPMERMIRDALNSAGVAYTTDEGGGIRHAPRASRTA